MTEEIITATLVVASTEKINQTLETVAHHISKLFEVRQKYSTVCRSFNSPLDIWKCDKVRSLLFDISHEVSPLIGYILFYFAAERKDAFEIMSIGKETYVFRASTSREYRRWLKYLRLEAKELGGWKRRRHGLPNIMIKNL